MAQLEPFAQDQGAEQDRGDRNEEGDIPLLAANLSP
jgi:hypothetical protein